jgi:glycosyltransferase involved in cell wall biosynthesis
VEAFEQTRAHKAGVKLVLCGQTPYFLDQIKAQVERAGLQDAVIFTGYATDGELATLYQQAEAYVFPSLCEGFGLPGLEAMAYGTPVLAARASSLPEVLGEAADYFDPLDVADMTRALDELLANPARQQQLRGAGPARVKEFSWRRMAEETLAVYQRIGSQ